MPGQIIADRADLQIFRPGFYLFDVVILDRKGHVDEVEFRREDGTLAAKGAAIQVLARD